MMGQYIEETTTCACCLELISNPQRLSCDHNVCFSCVATLLVSTQVSSDARIVRCPMCCSETRANEVNFNASLERNRRMSIQDDVLEKPMCGRCTKKEATLECLDCMRSEIVYLCSRCGDIIHTGNLKAHKTGNINSLKLEFTSRCSKHHKELHLLCEEDMVLICGHCMFDGHHGHKISPVGNVVTQMLPKINEHVGNLSKQKQQLRDAILNINNTIKYLAQDKMEMDTLIDTTFRDIRKLLDEKEASLRSEVEGAFNFTSAISLRSSLLMQLSSINECLALNSHLNSLGDLKVVELIYALQKLDKNIKIPRWETLAFETTLPWEIFLHAVETLKLESRRIFYDPTETGTGSDGHLVVKEQVVLDSSRKYNFLSVTVKQGGVLTVGVNSPLTMYVCGAVHIERGGSINLNGKGYVGGDSAQSMGKCAQQGGSYTGSAERDKNANHGGGGGGYGIPGGCGGGGGYGSSGESVSGKGGNVYGDALLTTLHLGSGGGGGNTKGGNGGGALRIIAIKLLNNGCICCDGDSGEKGREGGGGGGGSGGSIHLQVHVLENNGIITAKGGLGGSGLIFSKGAEGGIGRIRVDVSRNSMMGSITPQPGHIGVL